ncbi:MAG: twin-arginine translocase subunit TatC, partial [Actinomycetia bacterium]|nr:twin-arginine translocase subunit TatC [Actinomycetes bacterium]
MPIQAKRSPFFDHVTELRKRLTVCIVAVFAVTLICYQRVLYIFTVKALFRPVSRVLPNNGNIFAMGPFESMTLRFQVAFIAALVVTSPLLLYQIAAFFLPALKQKERKWLIPTTVAAILLFVAGLLFAYFIIMPPGFAWLINQAVGPVKVLPAASDYLSGITLFLLGFGISFELPLVVFYLIGFGILRYRAVRAGWRYVYVVLFVVAAIATPDWSPWPMIGLTAALIILYELSLFMAKTVFKRRVLEQDLEAWEDFQL